MNKPNFYEPPVTEQPRRAENRGLWVVFWLLTALIYGGTLVLIPGSDPISVMVFLVYGLVSFAMGVFFSKLIRSGKGAD